MQPRARNQLELLTVNGEAKSPGQDLNYCSAGRLVLGQLLAGVEAKDSHVHPVATVYDFRDHGIWLNGHFARGIDDQAMGHVDIFVRLGSSSAPSRPRLIRKEHAWWRPSRSSAFRSTSRCWDRSSHSGGDAFWAGWRGRSFICPRSVGSVHSKDRPVVRSSAGSHHREGGIRVSGAERTFGPVALVGPGGTMQV